MVLRADQAHAELNEQEMACLTDRATPSSPTDEMALDPLFGRQVWIEHERGSVSQSAHLWSVEENLRIGQPVEAGEFLGLIEASVTPAGTAYAGSKRRLHLELLDANGTALGDGLGPLEVHAKVARSNGARGTHRDRWNPVGASPSESSA
jgi:murein DD-endopeptidase MepM/ murein hydrolase activator NlpD